MSNIDTQMMIRQASNVRRVAEEMNHLNSVKLLGAADTVAAVWRGDAADMFLRHNTTTRDQIRCAVNELQRVAGEMERFARELESMAE